MKPILEPDVSVAVILLVAALNPAVIALGAYLGSRCDQAQKLPVAGFAAALAGMALIWIAAWFRLPFSGEAARAAGGVLLAQTVFGTLWAGGTYLVFRGRMRT